VFKQHIVFNMISKKLQFNNITQKYTCFPLKTPVYESA